MNKVILMGRPTADPEIRYGTGENALAIGRYTLAVNRRYVKEGEQQADFIRCVAFGKAAEFAEKWIKKGTKLLVTGRIQTGSYTNQDGVKIYTTEVVIEDQEFAESKKGEEAEPEENPDMDNADGVQEASQRTEEKPAGKSRKKKTKESTEEK